MRISSAEFKNKEMMPKKFTCQGDDINPSLIIEDVPKEAKSLALIMDDPDAPKRVFVHWVMFNIPIVSKIDENSALGIEGMNTAEKKGYMGPCPPSGVHRYFFKLYALDSMLDLDENATKVDLEKAMQQHILAQAELIGLYTKT